MSGIFPTTAIIENVRIVSHDPTLVSTSHSLARQVGSRGAHRWAIEITLDPHMDRDEAAEVAAFLLAQRGQYEIFNFLPPVYGTARGVATGTPRVYGASQSGRSILTDGWTADTAGILKKYDFLKFAGHHKVYASTADAAADAFGRATLQIHPALMESPGDQELITVADVPFRVSRTSDESGLLLANTLFQLPDKLTFIEMPD